MPSILSNLDGVARRAFESLGFPGQIAAVRTSDRDDVPYQCNGAMAAAGIAKKRGEKANPRDIAAQAVAIMEKDAAIGSLEIAGPGFINIFPADDLLLARAKDLLADPASGLKADTAKTVVVDYGGANVAKPMHVGHLRSAVLGEAIKRRQNGSLSRRHGAIALHFEQVFRGAVKAGWYERDQLFHAGFGTMNGKDGKPFKTREGGVLRLEDLMEIMSQAATGRLETSGIGADFEAEERTEIARKIGLAALKFADLQNQRMTNYIFDPERFTAFEGKTGPYLLYAVVDVASRHSAYISRIACMLFSPQTPTPFSLDTSSPKAQPPRKRSGQRTVW